MLRTTAAVALALVFGCACGPALPDDLRIQRPSEPWLVLATTNAIAFWASLDISFELVSSAPLTMNTTEKNLGDFLPKRHLILVSTLLKEQPIAAACTVEHELGHVLGMVHDDGDNKPHLMSLLLYTDVTSKNPCFWSDADADDLCAATGVRCTSGAR